MKHRDDHGNRHQAGSLARRGTAALLSLSLLGGVAGCGQSESYEGPEDYEEGDAYAADGERDAGGAPEEEDAGQTDGRVRFEYYDFKDDADKNYYVDNRFEDKERWFAPGKKADLTIVASDPVEPEVITYDNTVPEYDGSRVVPVEVNLEDYCDHWALEHARKTGTEDYLLWLVDQSVNRIEPQAVERVLQIPAFARAAEEGLISRYISLYLTYSEEGSFAAMNVYCALGADGNSVEEWDDQIGNIGQKIMVNLDSFGPETRDDPNGLQWLEDSMIHELVHAFMNDLTRNGSVGTDRTGHRAVERDEKGTPVGIEDDTRVLINSFPSWFEEGVAETAEAAYEARRDELREFIDTDLTHEEYLTAFSTPEHMMEYLDYWQEAVEEEKPEIAEEGARLTDITNEENYYSTGYVAALFLYSMAAEHLGHTVFDENGRLRSSALFAGMDHIFQSMIDGESLDDVIFRISTDPATGKPVYVDTEDFEYQFLRSVEDPGLIFWQRMMYDYEKQSGDPDTYIPSGCILPGFVNGKQSYMDKQYHSAPPVFAVANIEDPQEGLDYFAVSTVRPSLVALTGGKSISYEPEADRLTPEEARALDVQYIGDTVKLIGVSE